MKLRDLRIGEMLLSSLLDFFISMGLDAQGETSSEHELISLKVKAKPGAKIEKIQVGEGGVLEIFIKAKPVEGAANKALKKYLGKSFGIAPSQVELVKGDKSKLKSFQLSFIFATKSSEDYLEKIKKSFA